MKRLVVMLAAAFALFVGALGGTFSDGDALARSYDPIVYNDPGGCPIGDIRYEFWRYMDSGGSVQVRIFQCLAPGYWYEIGRYWQ